MKVTLQEKKGYKKTELGWIPEEWEIQTLDDHVDLLHGYQFRDGDFTEIGIPVIKISQISPTGQLNLSGLSYIDSNRLTEFSDKIIRNGDVLMSLTGNIGR